MASKAKIPFHLGLFVDSMKTTRHVYDLAQWARSHEHIEFTIYAIRYAGGCSRLDGNRRGFLAQFAKRFNVFSSILAGALWNIVISVESALLRRNVRYSGYFRKYDLLPLVAKVIETEMIILPTSLVSGFGYQLQEKDAKEIRKLNCDLLIWCCDEVPRDDILRGEILRASRFGIIAFHHADDRICHGVPAGFWEVFGRVATTGFAIQRLTEDPDRSDVLMQGRFATQHYYVLNKEVLRKKSYHYLKSVVEKIALEGNLPAFSRNLPCSNISLSAPRSYETAVYLLSFSYLMIKKQLEKRFGIHNRWNVAYLYCNWRDAVLSGGIRLENRPRHFLADPFVFSKDGTDYVFVEDYDYEKTRGEIAVYKLTLTGGTYVGIALEEKFHLSFPYIFEYKNEIYMCPETSENRDIRLYKCLEFPLKWKFEKAIMQNVSAADTLIFEQNERWWLFTNIDSTGDDDHCSELCIFSSDSPLANHWVPHPLNPVLVDASRARNGGLIKDVEGTYRISQGQGFDSYGEKVLINKIVELTESNYVESVICEVTPTFKKRVNRIHHFHGNEKITVFDFSISSKST
jgi:hypothetical protein